MSQLEDLFHCNILVPVILTSPDEDRNPILTLSFLHSLSQALIPCHFVQSNSFLIENLLFISDHSLLEDPHIYFLLLLILQRIDEALVLQEIVPLKESRMTPPISVFEFP